MTIHDDIMRAIQQATNDGANQTADYADAILASGVIDKVRAEALREAYADLQAYTDSGAPFGHRPVEEFLLHRADRIEKEVRRG